MGVPRFAPWLGALICGAIASAPAHAGGIFGLFSHRNSDTDQCSAEPVGCQQPCQPTQPCPPKKQRTCCLCPPEPPRAPVGTTFAAEPQAAFADPGQDDRFDKLEKDVTRLTLIVQKMLENQASQAPAQPQKTSAVPAPASSAVQQVSASAPKLSAGR